MDWWKARIGISVDPKLKYVAHESGQIYVVVLGVWVAILDAAARSRPKGRAALKEEEIAFDLGISIESVEVVVDVLRQRGLIVERNGAEWVTEWETSHQPTRRKEDKAAVAARVRKHRAKQKDVTDVTPPMENNPMVEHGDKSFGSVCEVLGATGGADDEATWEMWLKAGIDEAELVGFMLNWASDQFAAIEDDAEREQWSAPLAAASLSVAKQFGVVFPSAAPVAGEILGAGHHSRPEAPETPGTRTAEGHVGPARWRKRLDNFNGKGVWDQSWGPRPDQDGCLVPEELLAEV